MGSDRKQWCNTNRTNIKPHNLAAVQGKKKNQKITIWQLLRVPQTSTHHYLAAANWWTTNGTQKEWEHPSTLDWQASITAVCLTPIWKVLQTSAKWIQGLKLVVIGTVKRQTVLQRFYLPKQTTTGIHTSSDGLFHSYLGEGNRRERG